MAGFVDGTCLDDQSAFCFYPPSLDCMTPLLRAFAISTREPAIFLSPLHYPSPETRCGHGSSHGSAPGSGHQTQVDPEAEYRDSPSHALYLGQCSFGSFRLISSD